MRVLMECCLQEKVFNKYYTILGSKLCKHNKNHKFTLQVRLTLFVVPNVACLFLCLLIIHCLFILLKFTRDFNLSTASGTITKNSKQCP